MLGRWLLWLYAFGFVTIVPKPYCSPPYLLGRVASDSDFMRASGGGEGCLKGSMLILHHTTTNSSSSLVTRSKLEWAKQAHWAQSEMTVFKQYFTLYDQSLSLFTEIIPQTPKSIKWHAFDISIYWGPLTQSVLGGLSGTTNVKRKSKNVCLNVFIFTIYNTWIWWCMQTK